MGLNRYKIIYADPPRMYRNQKTGGSMISGSASKYPVISDDDICALPVSNIADNNAVLFLWATVPLLPETFDIMRAWGFEYKTAVFWRKIMSLGMGFWFRGQVELCLMGVRGKVKAFRCQKPNFIQSKVRNHSQKPEEMYKLIEGLGINPKIELFARCKRNGWDSIGFDIDSCDIKQRLEALGGI